MKEGVRDFFEYFISRIWYVRAWTYSESLLQ